MSIESVTRALLQALAAEGAAGAPWGNRVHLRAASSFVELSGAHVGEPAKASWPRLELVGPAVEEHRARRAPHDRENVSEDRTAGTRVVRPWPRFFHVTFTVTFSTRVGCTGAATASAQLAAAIDRFEGWLARTPKLEGANLISVAALSAANARRPTPADILEASGTLRVQDVPVYQAAASPVDTALDILVTSQVDPAG